MDWVTGTWAAMAGASLMMALTHLVIWCRNRQSPASLWLAVFSCGVIGLIGCEIVTMRTDSPAVYQQTVRWAHANYLLISLGLLGFVHCYFGTGTRWLMGLALGLRTLAVIANFTTGSSLHFISIQRLHSLEFLGQQVTLPAEWVPNPWVLLGQLSSLVLLVYVMDASLRLWRTSQPNKKRRSLLLGGSIILFIVLAAAIPGMVTAGILKIPMTASFPFFFIIIAMNYELSGDVLKAANLTMELKTSRERLSLAAAAARMALWEWNIPTGMIWVSDQGRELYGVAAGVAVDLDRFISTLHQDDRAAVSKAMAESVKGHQPFAAEYRVVLAEGTIRWISAIGKVEQDSHGRPLLMRGVSMDSTDRRQAEIQTELQRQELAHLSRVSILGELAGALAHELNQPLAAILSNAQVGTRSLKDSEPDLVEMNAILEDIAADAKRAGGIIHGMRAMLKRENRIELQRLHLNETLREVLILLNSQILSRKVITQLALSDSLPEVEAGQIEVQQVLINLLVNALDAMKAHPGQGSLHLSSSRLGNCVCVEVRDSGPGIPDDVMPRLFDPFFSTKSDGLGLGLSISRSIIERFGGQLTASNHPQGGAVFRMLLPIAS
jgi:two-component system sensor kinase FixL